MNKNDIYEIEITGMTEDGSGVGRAENRAVFVPYTIVGEVVEVIIIKVNKNYAVGKLSRVITPSEARTKAECPHFYKCGGCQLQHMDYEAELKYKHQKVEDCIRRIAKLDVDVSPIVGSDEIYRYRNKVQMPVSDKGIGFYRKNSHDVIDMDDCLLQSKSAAYLTKTVREWKNMYNISAYDEKSGNGLIRHIYTRDGDGGTLFVIVAAKDKLPKQNELTDMLKKCAKDHNINLAGILLNVNSKKTNTVLGENNIVLWGSDKIWDVLGGTKFEISPNSFYQVNKNQTVRLYNIAAKMAHLTGGETVWDLYCGIGTIGLFCAKSAKEILGIECVSQAVENAKINANLNGMENANYICKKVEDAADDALKTGSVPDVVFLDPPRKGCEESLLDTVIKVSPKKIVYISCKPSTLARDLKYLTEKGYDVKKITPVDMFPRTSHVETVVLMTRVNPNKF